MLGLYKAYMSASYRNVWLCIEYGRCQPPTVLRESLDNMPQSSRLSHGCNEAGKGLWTGESRGMSVSRTFFM